MYASFKYQQLRQVGISHEVALSIEPNLKVRSYSADQIVWKKGETINSWTFVISGLVAACVPTSNSASTPISTYGQNSWFGEQSIINRLPSYAQYVCLTACDTMLLPAPYFSKLLEQEPGFSKHVAELVSWRVQHMSELLMYMKLGNPVLRVVTGLAQIAEALAYRSERPPTIGFGEGVNIPVKQHVLAGLCGVSRTIVSEVLQKLAANGWVRISYGKLELVSIVAWHAYSRRQRARNLNCLNPSIEEILSDLNEFAEFN